MTPKTLPPPERAVGDDGRLRVFSNGGGVQSTAALILSAQKSLPYRTHLFSNVGDDSEHPGSVQFVRLIAQPYATAHDIDLLELHRIRRDGTEETLMQRLTREGSRSVPIPVRMQDTGAPGTRSCTADFKIRVIANWLKLFGATEPKRCRPHQAEDKAASTCDPSTHEASKSNTPLVTAKHGDYCRIIDRGPRADCTDCDQGATAHVGVGISADEAMRASRRREAAWEATEYPLLGIPDGIGRRIHRDECVRIISSEPLPDDLTERLRAMDQLAQRRGWTFDPFDLSTWTKALYPSLAKQLRETDFTMMPVPPKSSCYFCPFHRPSTWQAMRTEEPELFHASADLEDLLNERRDMLGKDRVYLTRFGQPLRDVIPAGVEMLPFADTDDAQGECDNGACWT